MFFFLIPNRVNALTITNYHYKNNLFCHQSKSSYTHYAPWSTWRCLATWRTLGGSRLSTELASPNIQMIANETERVIPLIGYHRWNTHQWARPGYHSHAHLETAATSELLFPLSSAPPKWAKKCSQNVSSSWQINKEKVYLKWPHEPQFGKYCPVERIYNWHLGPGFPPWCPRKLCLFSFWVLCVWEGVHESESHSRLSPD